MGDVQKTRHSLPLIDLTNDNALICNHSFPYIDLTENYDRVTNLRPDIIDLTDDDNQRIISNIPVTDLTGDDDNLLNYRIPVIDLTDDDAQDITNQTQCIDLTSNDASSSNHTIQNFDTGRIDDRGINLGTKVTDLTLDDIQDFNVNTSSNDLICDDDQFLNFRIRCTDTTNGVHDISHQLQNFVLTDDTQQIRNDCIPTVDLKNHSTDQIIPVRDLTNEKVCNNDRRQITDSIRNNGRVTRLVDDGVEMLHDFNCNNSHTNSRNGAIENLRFPAANLSCIATENDFLKYNETSNMAAMDTDTFSSMQKFHRKKEDLANYPPENFERRKETSLTNRPLKDFKYRKEISLTNNRQRKNHEEKIEMNLTNHPLRKDSEEKYFRRRQSEKITQTNTADFMKPARHPIPLRHSLGRSTVNTSKNVPIQCTEASEDESRILTVSSIMRRRKTKSVTDISEKNLPNSKELSTTRENTSSFETLKRIFLKIWIFLLFTFIGLYFWL